MTIDMAIRNLSNKFDKLDPRLQKATINTCKQFLEESRNLEAKEAEIDKKLEVREAELKKEYEHIIHVLTQRCYVYSKGGLCILCNIDCKFRKINFRDDNIDISKLFDTPLSELDEALNDGRLDKEPEKDVNNFKEENNDISETKSSAFKTIEIEDANNFDNFKEENNDILKTESSVFETIEIEDANNFDNFKEENNDILKTESSAFETIEIDDENHFSRINHLSKLFINFKGIFNNKNKKL